MNRDQGRRRVGVQAVQDVRVGPRDLRRVHLEAIRRGSKWATRSATTEVWETYINTDAP